MKLQSKIILSLIPFIGLPLIIVGWISYAQLRQTTELKTANEVHTILRQLETLIEEKVRTAEANVLLFSKSGLLQKYLLSDENSRYGLLQPALLRLFASYQEAYPDYYEIRVLLPDGFEDTG